jgi:hypothetical protein
MICLLKYCGRFGYELIDLDLGLTNIELDHGLDIAPAIDYPVEVVGRQAIRMAIDLVNELFPVLLQVIAGINLVGYPIRHHTGLVYLLSQAQLKGVRHLLSSVSVSYSPLCGLFNLVPERPVRKRDIKPLPYGRPLATDMATAGAGLPVRQFIFGKGGHIAPELVSNHQNCGLRRDRDVQVRFVMVDLDPELLGFLVDIVDG